MKPCVKAYLLARRALLTGAGSLIAFFFPLTTSQANSAELYNASTLDMSGVKIAAGYPLGPAPATPMPGPVVPPSGFGSGISTPPPALRDLAPNNSDLLQQENRAGSGHNEPRSANTNPTVEPAGKTLKVEGTIQYDVSLAPISSQPGLSVVQSMNEALINSPRAAAIRSQFGIARTGFAYATQGPNPVMFFDRAPVSEQVTRIGPNLTIEPPWKLAFRLLSTKRLVDQTKLDLLAEPLELEI